MLRDRGPKKKAPLAAADWAAGVGYWRRRGGVRATQWAVGLPPTSRWVGLPLPLLCGMWWAPSVAAPPRKLAFETTGSGNRLQPES